MADVVGYSRQMERDEAGTVRRLQSMRQEVVEPQTLRFRGRIVDTAGDGWLAEFASVTDAVQSSLAIQDAMQARNANLPRDDRFELTVHAIRSQQALARVCQVCKPVTEIGPQ